MTGGCPTLVEDSAGIFLNCIYIYVCVYPLRAWVVEHPACWRVSVAGSPYMRLGRCSLVIDEL